MAGHGRAAALTHHRNESAVATDSEVVGPETKRFCPMIAQPYQLYVERMDPTNMARFYAMSIEATLFETSA